MADQQSPLNLNDNQLVVDRVAALPPKPPTASWTPERVSILMECLEEETKSGTYTDSGFKGAGWKAIQTNFNKR
jgi:hypothetical protein